MTTKTTTATTRMAAEYFADWCRRPAVQAASLSRLYRVLYPGPPIEPLASGEIPVPAVG